METLFPRLKSLIERFESASGREKNGLGILAFGEISPANDAEIIQPDGDTG